MYSNYFREITHQYMSQGNKSPSQTCQNFRYPIKYSGFVHPSYIKQDRLVNEHTAHTELEDFQQDENIYTSMTQIHKTPIRMKINPICQATMQGLLEINPTNLFSSQLSNEFNEKANLSPKEVVDLSKKDQNNQSGNACQYPSENINLYLEAKKCELNDQDLDKAVYYYTKCLEFNQKRDSALKDLATVYHKQGKTQLALELLLKEKENYQGDLKTYENLICTLEKQLVPTGKVYLKFILLYNSSKECITNNDINNIFPKIKKVKQMYYFRDLSLLNPIQNGISNICLLEFNSYSNAKKIIEGSMINQSTSIKCFLVDIMGKVKIHILDNKNFDRELIEYQNPYLQPTTFSQSLLFIFQDKGSQEIINSDDKKYTWTQDQLFLNQNTKYIEFQYKSRQLENELTIQSLLKKSKLNSQIL
ncbi:hypothetical protein TTHERM_00092800 (macronuclear) [Tetrahymena thermophila SB210]|uniref:Uncharacterized protein n=1 Tax=Tetrahymena thermophila (strain SB210) TaxID=312017 RepID=Q236B2_TETTS|nr:hypothetical protein TTHERM_00092800 [Tetrahymena thermophila SB210]EAR92588.2 hypothetical protein TTHERM_00092800 [Tetrahymena thermophila SB210]|eukprot:XP_001012833.2 hypothetical protein TTHERM_00092800 [Tetrahymena thermophila SB210]